MIIRSLTFFALVFGSTGLIAAASPTDLNGKVQSQFKTDIAFMASLEASQSSHLHTQIFGGPPNGNTYSKFFNSRIHSAEVGDCGASWAYACVFGSEPTVMRYQPTALSLDLPQVERAQLMIHESRHSESARNHYSHEICPKGITDSQGNSVDSRAGELACDAQLDGAYGISTIMLKNIENFCTNCTDKVKADAGMYANQTLVFILNPREQIKFFDDILAAQGKTRSTTVCTYATSTFTNSTDTYTCPNSVQYMLIEGDQPHGCYVDLPTLNGRVKFLKIAGECA